MTRLLFAVLLALPACAAAETPQRLDAAFLLGSEALEQPLSTREFTPAEGTPTNRFEGLLTLRPSAANGRIRVIRDTFDYAALPELDIANLPAFRFQYVQHGSFLIPLKRGPQAAEHPHWEFILEPGRAWDAGEDGWSRAALPFALQERNANCTHNGLMTFLFRDDGSISRVAYQIAGETCQYFQADLWGVLEADYLAGPVAGAERVIAGFEALRAARLPVRPLAALYEDYEGLDAGQLHRYPAGEISAVGFVANGVHYRGDCPSRMGPYPFCDVLDLPSYSLAKSIFAGLAWMMLEQELPGIGRRQVRDYIPECSGRRWQGVTLEHLVDMTTGNFRSTVHDVDEFASYETAFMSGDTHAQKVRTACTLFPRQAEPGTTFAYHTSDTYLAGTMMNALLAQNPPENSAGTRDIHRDVLHEKLFRPLGLSPVMGATRRTYDAVAQPFAGYGLTLHSDDIARLGAFLAIGDGRVRGKQVIEPGLLAAALQREPRDPGVQAGAPELRYNNGFWAYRTDLQGACEEPLWIPFLSGYGGISVVILPNRTVFYVFSDHGRFEWLSAALASNIIKPMCE